MRISIPFLKPRELSAIFKIAFPLMAAFSAQKAMQLIDTLMMGWIGVDALAAGALATGALITVLVFCLGTISAVGVCIARFRGADNLTPIKSVLQNGIFLAVILAIPAVVLLWNAPHFLRLIGEEPQIVYDSKLFLHAIVWGFPFLLIFYVLREFVAAFSLTRVIMIIAFCSLPFTVILNYIFIYGKLGMPALGIAGIGFTNAFIYFGMFLSLLIYSLLKPELQQHIPPIKTSLFQIRQIKEFLVIGIPSGLMLVLDSGMFATAAVMMSYFGVHALAAHQVAMQYASAAFTVPFALSMATALLVGNAVGANDFHKAIRFTLTNAAIVLIIATIIAIIFITIPKPLITLYLNPHDSSYNLTSFNLAISILAFSALFQVFDGLQTILGGALRGFKDTFVPMVCCFTCYWILGMGSAYFLAFHTRLAYKGIWYGLTLGIIGLSIILIFRFIYISKKFVMESKKYSSVSHLDLASTTKNGTLTTT